MSPLVERLRAMRDEGRIPISGGRYYTNERADLLDEAAERITQLEARQGELVEALRSVDEKLWAKHGSNNVEALIACLKEIETVVAPFQEYRTALAQTGDAQ